MQLLPPLVTAHASVALPLSDGAAQRILAALGELDAALVPTRLASALSDDAPLALWTVCRAAQRGHSNLVTLAQLAEWLAGALLDELRWPRCEGDAAPGQHAACPAAAVPGFWPTLAAQSLATAHLAARGAEHARLDPQRAYLLALLHAAPKWLASAAGSPNTLDPAQLLPPWLDDALAAIGMFDGGDVSSVEQCAALAVRLSSGKKLRQPGAKGFKFNRRRHDAEVARHRQAWGEPSAGAIALSAIVDKLARLKQLEQDFLRTLEHEKLDALKELAYGAGHEINNPLANISARAQTLLQLERDPDRRRMLAAINSQTFRAHEMIADMMLLARPPEPRFERVDLAQTVRELVDELGPQAASTRCELLLNLPDTAVTVRADKTQISVALRAVCTNAFEALVGGGRVEVTLHEPSSSCRNAQITVADNGPGIAEEVRRHIFDPFFSGREAGRGLGFGLSKCWRIVTMHGGQIEVASSPGNGARFTISLPKSDER